MKLITFISQTKFEEILSLISWRKIRLFAVDAFHEFETCNYRCILLDHTLLFYSIHRFVTCVNLLQFRLDNVDINIAGLRHDSGLFQNAEYVLLECRNFLELFGLTKLI